jgi:hypothetical protein
VPKLYIPSAINTWRKLLSTDILADKEWAGFWQISLYIKYIHMYNLEILNNICRNLDFNPEYSIQFIIIFTQITWKVKEITFDLIHDLIFYCILNPLLMPEHKVNV